MQIPKSPADRDGFYDEIARDCLVSRGDRISFYERMRSYYLHGCDGSSDPATFNKIFAGIEQLAAFEFSAETTRFGINIGENANLDIELPKVPALTRRLNANWSDSNCDILYGMSLRWSHAFGSMFLKLVQQRGERKPTPYLVDPHSFGVYREDMPFLSDQEAFVHTYTISHRALERMLVDHPRRKHIVDNVTASLKQGDTDNPGGLQRIVMSSMSMTNGPSGPGQLTGPYSLTNTYRAKTADERVFMRELWIWDDELNDYRIVTLASGAIYIYDRQNFGIPGDHPFTQICPNPAYDYFWGTSDVDRLTQLQDLREMRLEQIVELLNRQVKPPSSLRGQWQGITDETNYAAQVFGASMASNDPTAEIKTFYPTVPQDTYAEVREIDTMFNEQLGLTNITQGKGESGVRSKGHAAELGRLGSARIKNRAFTLEDGLDRIGTQYLKLMQMHDDVPMKSETGQKFIPEQFTKDAVVSVDAHSSSPIFVEDQKSLANELFEARAIDRAEFIQMKDPPNKQVMLRNLKKIEKAEADAAKAQQAAEAKKEGLRVAK